jgi:DNA helicase-2/ATP-dependent DNA helicase PcrA
MTIGKLTPAEAAAADAQARVHACLDAGQSFRLEAGAGAGKTYSLVEALKSLIISRGTELLQAGQKVACITFTQVARDEIAQEIEQHPAILVETIHAFSWGILAQFQNALRDLVGSLEERRETILEGGGIGKKPVEYNHGYFGVDEERITLAHDDIPQFMAQLLGQPKFRDHLKRLYPVIFIDEYQDTDPHFMAAISEHFFQTKEGPLIGLFGDHWQTIYRGDFDLADFPVEGIDKASNFRSAPAIVNALNELRPELPQEVSNPAAEGEARFFHSNSYHGERSNTAHSKNDVPEDVARQLMTSLLNRLETEGWDLAPSKTKVLMLTHSALAAEQGYPSIAALFNRSEAFAKKEDPTIEFFADTLEPMSRMYAARKYGEMFKILGSAPAIRTHADKVRWKECMDTLNELRTKGTIGSVLDHLKDTRRPQPSDRVMRREQELTKLEAEPASEESTSVSRQRELRAIPYCEVVELVKYIEGSTPFATQHSVKGAEFENVLVVLGGGWNHYNWPQLLDLLETKAINSKNTKGFHRARNLFYVAISRPKKRLAILATQTMSDDALKTAARLFGAENVEGLDLE